MPYTYKELADWDLFFYYGKNDLQMEIESDLMLLCLQYPRSLYYDCKESGGVAGYENHPNDLNLQINARFDITKAVAWKNTIIADGRNNLPDRRIAVSQNSISFKINGGELDVNILYIPYYNYNNYTTINLPMAGSA